MLLDIRRCCCMLLYAMMNCCRLPYAMMNGSVTRVPTGAQNAEQLMCVEGLLRRTANGKF